MIGTLLTISLTTPFLGIAATSDTPAPTDIESDFEPAVERGDRWSGFRGAGSGHTLANELPIRWSDPIWSVPFPGTGQSSPVVYGGRVFVTGVEGVEKERAIVSCFRLSDGHLLWSRSFQAATRITLSDMVSQAAPTPTVDADRVYAFFESGDLISLDHEGNVAWHRDLFSEYGPFKGNHGLGSSPVLSGSTVLVLLDHEGASHLVAMDVASGKNRWVQEREPRVSWSSPIVSNGGDEVIVSSNGDVQGLSIEDGSLRWIVKGIEGNTVPSPTFLGDRVLVGQSKGAGVSLIARPSNEGEATAPASLVWAGEGLSPSGFGSPIVRVGSALLLNKAGVLYSVSLETGALEWKKRLACGSTWASPISNRDHVWFFGKGGVTSVLHFSASGSDSGSANGVVEVATNEVTGLEGGVYGAAAVDGFFVLRTPTRLVCVGEISPVEPAAEEGTEEDPSEG